MGYRSHQRAPRAVWPAYRGLQRHRLRKAREAAADPAFLNGDRPWVEISSLLNGRLFLSRAASERVAKQRSMIHRYATKNLRPISSKRALSEWRVIRPKLPRSRHLDRNAEITSGCAVTQDL